MLNKHVQQLSSENDAEISSILRTEDLAYAVRYVTETKRIVSLRVRVTELGSVGRRWWVSVTMPRSSLKVGVSFTDYFYSRKGGPLIPLGAAPPKYLKKWILGWQERNCDGDESMPYNPLSRKNVFPRCINSNIWSYQCRKKHNPLKSKCIICTLRPVHISHFNMTQVSALFWFGFSLWFKGCQLQQECLEKSTWDHR